MIKLLTLFFPLLLWSQSYSRSEFGDGWATYRGCINVREQVLIAKSAEPVLLDDKGCSVVRGIWLDTYSGIVYNNPELLDIDHVVPLKWAWEHGANSWDRRKRIAFANFLDDSKHLLPVSQKLNRSKGDKGPDRWLPPTGQCGYILNFSRIVAAWNLVFSPEETKKIESLRKFYCGR